MEEIERSAASVEEAVEAALAELGLSEQEAHIEIVQEPRGGFLRRGGHGAVVRVRRMAPEEPESADLSDQTEIVMGFLDSLTKHMGVEVEVEADVVEGITYVDLWGLSDADDMGLLIGKGGHTLDALQELARVVVQQQSGERCLVLVDVEDYRKRRRSQLRRMARDVGKRVKRTGKPEALQPMSALERKIVHNAVAELGELATTSEGEEPNRRVVVHRAAAPRD
jgi:spoIIIJ-associated protein